MSCDIHLFLERKRSHDREWHLDPKHNASMPVNSLDGVIELMQCRSYEFFGELAGIRYKSNKVKPKGIPKNASKEFTNICALWGEDAYSHSWISISKYAFILKKIGFSYGFSAIASNARDPFLYDPNVRYPLQVVLAYIHDEKQSNKINYILTNDNYYLDEKFRLVFFFDN